MHPLCPHCFLTVGSGSFYYCSARGLFEDYGHQRYAELAMKINPYMSSKPNDGLRIFLITASRIPRVFIEHTTLCTIFTIILTFLGKPCNAHMLHASGVHYRYIDSRPNFEFRKVMHNVWH